MNAPRLGSLLRLVLLAAFVLSPAASPASAAPHSDISRVVPLLSIFGAFAARNRVYRDAEEFIQDRNAYYDRLRDTAHQQLLARDVATLRLSQAAAGIKLLQSIEQERNATLAIAESLKGTARKEFQKRLQNAITSAILGSGPAQQLLGALQHGIGSARDAVDAGLNQLSGGGAGALAQVNRIRRVAEKVNLVASNIGGPTGAGMRRASDRILRTISGVTQPIEADLRKVAGDLDGLADTVDGLSRAGKAVSGSVTARDVAIRLVDRESDNPTLDAITQILTQKSTDASNLRQKAKDQLRQGFVVRCVAKASNMLAAIAELEGGPPVSAEQVVAACQSMTESEQAAGEDAGGAAGEAGGAGDVHLKGSVRSVTGIFIPTRTQVNEIILSFPAGGGDINGTMEYIVDFDGRIVEADAPCTFRFRIVGTLTGVYNSDSGQLEGPVTMERYDVVVVSGCPGGPLNAETAAGAWEGQFDPVTGLATGQISVSGESDTLVLSFEARPSP